MGFIEIQTGNQKVMGSNPIWGSEIFQTQVKIEYYKWLNCIWEFEQYKASCTSHILYSLNLKLIIKV